MFTPIGKAQIQRFIDHSHRKVNEFVMSDEVLDASSLSELSAKSPHQTALDCVKCAVMREIENEEYQGDGSGDLHEQDPPEDPDCLY